jgi:hypothetical protein
MEPMPVTKELSWSRNVESHLALLEQSVSPSQQAVAVPAIPPQGTDAPKWETVSIKPCNDDSPRAWRPRSRSAAFSRQAFHRVHDRRADDQNVYSRDREPTPQRLAFGGPDPKEFKGAPSFIHSANG